MILNIEALGILYTIEAQAHEPRINIAKSNFIQLERTLKTGTGQWQGSINIFERWTGFVHLRTSTRSSVLLQHLIYNPPHSDWSHGAYFPLAWSSFVAPHWPYGTHIIPPLWSHWGYFSLPLDPIEPILTLLTYILEPIPLSLWISYWSHGSHFPFSFISWSLFHPSPLIS